MFPSPSENNLDMMPSAVCHGNCEYEVIMFIRFFAALLLCTFAAMPALAEVKSSTDKIADAFMQLDLDASESVSFQEYQEMVNQRAKKRFDKMDRNHDGQVSDEEYRNFWRTNKAKWYRLKR